jgi:bacterioferritin B
MGGAAFRPPATSVERGRTLLHADLRKLLIAQIGNELAAHSLYLAIAIYFERQSLKGWGKVFRDQSVEEAQHAMRIVDFLIDNEVDFDLPALKATSTRFASPSEAAHRALDSERTVAQEFDRAAAVAIASADHRGFQFLQWFIAEQVEEEAKLQHIVDLIESGANLFLAEAQLDAFE